MSDAAIAADPAAAADDDAAGSGPADDGVAPTASAARLALEGLLVAIGALLASLPVLRLWQQPFSVPFDYENDATFYLMLVRSMKENGWYLSNPSMGFPFGQEMHDLALGGDNLNFLVQRVLAQFMGPATALNVFFLFTIATVAGVAHVVLRLLGVRTAVAAVVAVIYTFLPFHLIRRTPHALLSSYAMVPVGVLLALAVMSAVPPLVGDRPGWWPGLRGGSRTWWVVASCALLASTGSYYAAFAGLLIVAGGVAAALARRTLRPVWSAAWMGGIIVVVTLLNTAPSIIYWLRNGTNPHVAHRLAQDTELYGLRIQQLFLPRLQHRNGWASRLADRAWAGPVRSEPGQQLGVIAACGLAVLLVLTCLALVRRTAPAEGSRRQTVEHMGLLAIVAMLTAAVSGLSFLLALGGLTWIRGWNRISVVLGFLALVVVAFAVERVVDVVRQRRGERVGQAALAAVLAVLLLVAWYDQTSPIDTAVRGAVRQSWESDAELFGEMEDALPAGSAVYEFPAMTFPEGGGIGAIGLYDGARGYLHAPSLKWNFGGMLGRVFGPRPELETQDPAATIAELRDVGFRAVLVDRFGYADAGDRLIAALGSVVPEAGTSPDGRYVWFDLGGADGS